MPTIGELLVKLGVDPREFQKELIKAERQTRTFQQRSSKHLAGIDSSFRTLRNAVVGFAAAVGAVRFAGMIRGAIESTDQIAKLSDGLGLSTELLSTLRVGAERTGTEFSTLATAMQRIIRRSAEMRDGTGVLIGVQHLMTEELKDAIKAGESIEQLWPKLVRQFESMTDQGQKMRLAMSLADTEGAQPLIRALKGGTKAMAEWRQEAKDSGTFITREIADRAADAGDKLEDLARRWEGLKLAMADFAASAGANKVLERANENLSAMKKILDLFGGKVLLAPFGPTDKTTLLKNQQDLINAMLRSGDRQVQRHQAQRGPPVLAGTTAAQAIQAQMPGAGAMGAMMPEPNVVVDQVAAIDTLREAWGATTGAIQQFGESTRVVMGETVSPLLDQTRMQIEKLVSPEQLTITQEFFNQFQVGAQQIFETLTVLTDSFFQTLGSIVGELVFNAENASEILKNAFTAFGKFAIATLVKLAAQMIAFKLLGKAVAAETGGSRMAIWSAVTYAAAFAGAIEALGPLVLFGGIAIAEGFASAAVAAMQGGASIAGGVGKAQGIALAGLAEGGIVTRPTLALIGEGGTDEAVVPLDDRHLGPREQHITVMISEEAVARATLRGLPRRARIEGIGL